MGVRKPPLRSRLLPLALALVVCLVGSALLAPAVSADGPPGSTYVPPVLSAYATPSTPSNGAAVDLRVSVLLGFYYVTVDDHTTWTYCSSAYVIWYALAGSGATDELDAQYVTANSTYDYAWTYNSEYIDFYVVASSCSGVGGSGNVSLATFSTTTNSLASAHYSSAPTMGNATSTTGTTTTLTLTLSVGAGSGIAVEIAFTYSSPTLTVTDSRGDTYAVYQWTNSTGVTMPAWSAWYPGPATAGSVTITITFSSSPGNHAAARAIEVKRPSGAAVLVLGSESSNLTETHVSGGDVSIDPSAGDELVLAMLWGGSAVGTISTPTAGDVGTFVADGAASQTAGGGPVAIWGGADTGAGNATITWTWTGSDSYDAAALIIYAATAADAQEVDSGTTFAIKASETNGLQPVYYTWQSGGSTVGHGTWYNFSSTTLGANYVYLNATDALGRTASTVLSEVIVIAAATASFTASLNPGDVGTSVTFTASVTGGVSPYNYTWAIGGTTAGNGSSWAHVFASPGSYTVGLTVTDADGGTATHSVTETIDSLPTISASTNVSSADVGYPIEFSSTPNGGDGGDTYSWVLGSTVLSTAESFSYAFTATGSQTMYVTVKDDASQTDTASVTVTINANPTSGVVTTCPTAVDVSYACEIAVSLGGGTGTVANTFYVNGVAAATGTSFNFEAAAEGGYTVTGKAVDGEGHSVSYSIETISVEGNPGLTLQGSHSTLDVGVPVRFYANATSGTSPYTYSWELNGNGIANTTSSIWEEFASAGTQVIHVVVTDADGHTVSATVDAYVDGDVTATISASVNPTDSGKSVTFSVSPSSGTTPYAYSSWTYDSETESSCGTASTCTLTFTTSTPTTTTIGVTVHDAGGSVYTPTFTETVDPAPVVLSIRGSPNPVDSGYTAAFTATTEYGTGTITFRWTVDGTVQSSTTSTMSAAFYTTGDYTIEAVATDSLGGTGSLNYSETVDTAPSVSLVTNGTTWDTGVLDHFHGVEDGGTGPWTYSWTVDGTPAHAGAYYNTTFTSTGDYTVEVTLTDATGATATASVTVDVVGEPTPTVSAEYNPVDVTISDLFTVSIVGGVAPFTYAWKVNGTVEQSGSSTTFAWTAATAGGAYSVVVQVTDSVGGIESSSSLSVTVEPAPHVSASGPIETDVGLSNTWSGSVEFGVGPYTYAWVIDTVSEGTGTSASYTFSSAGTYSGTTGVNLTITDSEGSKGYWTTSVTVYASVSASTPSAAYTTIDSGETDGITLSWTGGVGSYTLHVYNESGTSLGSASGATSPITVNLDLLTGTYAVYFTVFDSLGQSATSGTVAVTVHATPMVSLSETYSTIDTGLSDTITATVAGGTAPFTYSWTAYPSGGTSLTYSGATAHFSTSSVGTYAINVTAADAWNRPQYTIYVYVIAPPTVTFGASPTEPDAGITVQFSATDSGGVGALTLAWTVNGAAEGSTNPLQTDFGSGGTYWVNVTVTDALGITGHYSLHLTVDAPPAVTLSESTTVTDVDHSIAFNANATLGLPAYTYAWAVNGTSGETGAAATIPFDSVGTFVVSVTVTDADGVTAERTVTITVHAALGVTIHETYGDVDVDVANIVQLTATDGTTPYSYTWTIDGALQSSTAASISPEFASPGVYYVNGTAADAIGESEILSVSVAVFANVTASIVSAYLDVDVGVSDTFTAGLMAGVGPYTYAWLLEGHTYSATVTTFVTSFPTVGEYPLQLTVSDDYGRQSTVDVDVQVYADPVANVTLVNPPSMASQVSEYHVTYAGGYGTITSLWTYPLGDDIAGAWANYTWDQGGPNDYELTFADGGGYSETLPLTQVVQLNVLAVANVTRGPGPLTVTFTESVLGGESYSIDWSFGDGQQSAASVIQQVFPVGNWTVELAVTSANGAKGWANITIVSMPSPVVLSYTPSSDVTIYTPVTLAATPTWAASTPETATWTLPNGTELHGLSVTTTFTAYASTQTVLVVFTYGSGTEWAGSLAIVMSAVAPHAAATGIQTPIIPGTLLSVSGTPSTSPDATVLTYNWTLGGLVYHGIQQYFWFNATGSFTLSLTVRDSLGATNSTRWTIVVEQPGTNSSISIFATSTTTGQVTDYTVYVSSPTGISAADAFLSGSQLLPLTLINDTDTDGAIVAADYSLTIDSGTFEVGSYSLTFVAWSPNGQSNSYQTQLSVGASGTASGSSFDLISLLGGEGNFWVIMLSVAGLIATVAALRRQGTVTINLGGVQLVGREGKPLMVEKPKNKGGKL